MSRILALSLAALALVSCGSGTAALVSGSGGGSGNAATSVSGLTVLDAKTAPARVRFVLTDEEGDPARVSLFYALPGQAAAPLARVVGGVPASFATARNGVAHELAWDFPGEAGVPADGSFLEEVTVFALVDGGVSEVVPGANAATVGVGNDAPVALILQAPGGEEVSGVVGFELELSDSSDDLASARVEYDVLDDAPDAGWTAARPAGEQTTPELGVRDVVASREGSSVAFFWDAAADLGGLERDVRLRFTPTDGVAQGLPATTDAIRVDQNEAPRVELVGALLAASTDRLGGIPIPLEVSDAEGDEVTLAVQWTPFGQPFPELPADPAELRAALDDPQSRAALRVVAERPRSAAGRVLDGAAGWVSCPELASAESWAVGRGLVDRPIELLRRSRRPEPVAAGWRENPLQGPVAALPLGDGVRALVLDAPGPAEWRLRELELATGTVAREVAQGSGAPAAMAPERGRSSVVVALGGAAGAWSLVRVGLDDRATTELVPAGAGSVAGRVRGLASLGSGAAVLTVGGALLRADYHTDDAPRAAVLLDGLHRPAGVAVDTSRPGVVLLADRAGPEAGAPGRLLRLELARGAPETVPLFVGGQPLALAAAGALAYDPRSHRALVATDAGDGTTELVQLELGSLGAHEASVLASLPGRVAAVALGADGLALACLPDADELAVGGGVLQRRTVASYDPATRRILPDAPFEPPAAPGQRWRVPFRVGTRVVARPEGDLLELVWDSEQAFAAERVDLRAVAVDTEAGAASTLAAPLPRANPFAHQVRGAAHPVSSSGHFLAVADVDGDGREDAVTLSQGQETFLITYQGRAGELGAEQEVLAALPPDADGFHPQQLEVVDLDGDGRRDLLAVCRLSSVPRRTAHAIRYREPGGGWSELQWDLAPIETNSFQPTRACDLDADGALDLVTYVTATAVYFRRAVGPRAWSWSVRGIGGGALHAEPRSFDVADFDGDGDADLAALLAQAPRGMAVLLQDAGGAFEVGPFVEADGSSTFQDARARDLDGDGRVDLADEGELAFQRGPLEFGPFQPAPAFFLEGFADVDGDGGTDLVVVNGTQRTVDVARQLEPGSFVLSALGVGPDLLGQSSLNTAAAADFDGDGAADLVLGTGFGRDDEVRVHLRGGAGSFRGPGVLLEPPLAGSTGLRPLRALADCDGDGRTDVVMVGATLLGQPRGLVVWRQTSAGRFAAGEAPLVLEDGSFSAVDLQVRDVDGDGLPDAVVASSATSGPALRIVPRTANGWDAPHDVDALPAGGGPPSVVVTDLDGDGDADLALLDAAEGAVHLALQTGPMEFAPAAEPLMDRRLTGASGWSAGDLDGDGDDDLLAPLAAGGSLVFRNEGASGVSREGELLPAPATFAAQLVDLDADGRLDLLWQGAGGAVAVSFGEETGGFGPAVLSETGLSQVAAVAAGDLDGDGDLDLLAGRGFSTEDLVVLLQSSPRRWSRRARAWTSSLDFSIGGFPLLADVDGDGACDAVVGRPQPALSTPFVAWGEH